MSTLVADIKLILIDPRAAWGQIEARGTPARDAVVNHLAPLALIPAVAQFIGASIVGVQLFGTTYRVPLLRGLVGIPLTFIVTIVSALILAAILRVLAPRFGGNDNWDRAVNLVCYGGTAALLGGVFSILPMLSILGLAAGIYAIYTLYLGLVPMLNVDAARRGLYLFVSLVLAFICNLILGTVLMPFTATPAVEDVFRSSDNSELSAEEQMLNSLGEFGRMMQRALEEQANQAPE